MIGLAQATLRPTSLATPPTASRRPSFVSPLQGRVGTARFHLTPLSPGCLIYSWFPNLEYGFTDGTSNSGAGHSLMTAAEPWSGFYQVNAPLAAVAHWTQFAQRGWTFLSLNASRGIGPLPDGGSYATLVNTHTPAGELEFSIVAQTMQGATGPQTVTFGLGGLGGRALPAALHVWQSTQGALMVQQPDVPVLVRLSARRGAMRAVVAQPPSPPRRCSPTGPSRSRSPPRRWSL